MIIIGYKHDIGNLFKMTQEIPNENTALKVCVYRIWTAMGQTLSLGFPTQ